MSLAELIRLFAAAGCSRLYAKPLSENDNSKNQVYFAGAVEALNIFPSVQIFAENTKKGPSFKVKLNFGWLQESGATASAPKAQLILYSQYPEVRFSGFLYGCAAAPSELMVPRPKEGLRSESLIRKITGRVLFLGVAAADRVIGYVAAGDSEIAGDFRKTGLRPTIAVFTEMLLPNALPESDTRIRLLGELQRINRLGWIDSKQLDADGTLRPCNAQQCGGFTLEAELGIPKNSSAEPDFLGWEVKQHTVANLLRPNTGSAITLMTPEPTSGFYAERGPQEFVRHFGYPDKQGRPDRLNFGGVHKVGQRQSITSLTMLLTGYDLEQGLITDANGAIQLVSSTGEIAAAWPFDRLFVHWSRKHTKAVYVPSMCRKEPVRQYAYGHRVRLAQHTDSLRLLRALALGDVYYDPGIKLEFASTNPKVKTRSQFRIASKNINILYETVEVVNL
jgi:hypothetical protein